MPRTVAGVSQVLSKSLWNERMNGFLITPQLGCGQQSVLDFSLGFWASPWLVLPFFA